MKPLELRTPPFRSRDKSQFQPWCEDDRVHRVAPLLTFEVIDAVDWCVFLVPLGLVEVCACNGTMYRCSPQLMIRSFHEYILPKTAGNPLNFWMLFLPQRYYRGREGEPCTCA